MSFSSPSLSSKLSGAGRWGDFRLKQINRLINNLHFLNRGQLSSSRRIRNCLLNKAAFTHISILVSAIIFAVTKVTRKKLQVRKNVVRTFVLMEDILHAIYKQDRPRDRT